MPYSYLKCKNQWFVFFELLYDFQLYIILPSALDYMLLMVLASSLSPVGA